ncbi:MAG: SGNH/GDSL hydrolase family protein [Planctomycetota bacterium]|nr:MAG: SGNH/GDSL hydrolase family protein [Planctomycetota bacterium]
MKDSYLIYSAIIFSISFLSVNLQGKNKKENNDAEHLVKASSNPKGENKLPNILIIGDSISLGYTVPVRKLLDGKANVFRPPGNCQHSGRGLRYIKKWVGDKKWDVIHFNFGIWDSHYLKDGKLVSGAKNFAKYKLTELKLRYTTKEYLENITKILAVLKKTKAKIIWASTTPVTFWNKERKVFQIEKNKAVAKLMKKEGVSINDLYAFVNPEIKKWQRRDGCHFTKVGSNNLAKKVVESITKELRHKKKKR